MVEMFFCAIGIATTTSLKEGRALSIEDSGVRKCLVKHVVWESEGKRCLRSEGYSLNSVEIDGTSERRQQKERTRIQE